MITVSTDREVSNMNMFLYNLNTNVDRKYKKKSKLWKKLFLTLITKVEIIANNMWKDDLEKGGKLKHILVTYNKNCEQIFNYAYWKKEFIDECKRKGLDPY